MQMNLLPVNIVTNTHLKMVFINCFYFFSILFELYIFHYTDGNEDSEESPEEENSIEKQLKNRYDTFHSDETRAVKRKLFSAWAGKRGINPLNRDVIIKFLKSTKAKKDKMSDNELEKQSKKALFQPWNGKRGYDDFQKRRPWGGENME